MFIQQLFEAPYEPLSLSAYCSLADHRVSDGGAAHAVASGSEESRVSAGSHLQGHKKTPASLGWELGLILALLRARPSLLDLLSFIN